ncbi:MAG: D-aminoacyl-tRNA deacylase [Thermodesulfobacteriota bacterium]
MKAVLQRVKKASVIVEGSLKGSIEQGLLVYLGVEREDSLADLDYIAGKVRFLRIFADKAGRMNLDVSEAGGAVLLISQFTLLADCRKGRRPGLSCAEDPKKAEELYELCVKSLEERGLHVETGTFGAHMEVESLNDGPVTMLLDSRDL